MAFTRWKVVEEQKVAALVAGSRLARRRLQALVSACRVNDDTRIDANPKTNPALRAALREARAAMIPEVYLQRTLQLAAQGATEAHFPEYDTDWDSEAYLTVAGQNSNNSLRVPNDFFDVLAQRRRVDAQAPHRRRAGKKLPASSLWDEIAYAAWACADPGVQYDTTINEWHTCPADGRINASNPCVTGDTLVATTDGLAPHRRAGRSRPSRVIGCRRADSHLDRAGFPTGREARVTG